MIVIPMRIGPAVLRFEAPDRPHDAVDDWSYYWLFRSSVKESPTLRLSIHYDGPPARTDDTPLGEITGHWRLFRQGDGYRLEIMERVKRKPKQIVLFNATWTEARVHMIPYTYRAPARLRAGWVMTDLMEPLIQWWLPVWLAFENKGMVLHASAVNVDQNGFAFVGPSGAGKSTMARLFFNSTRGAVLSDERIVVWKEGARWWVSGTPWHGDLHEMSCTAVPLRQFNYLAKAKENRFELLTASRLMPLILAQTFVPLWNPEAMGHLMDLQSALFAEVPSGRLHFRKDPSVMDYLLKDCTPVPA